MKSLGLLLWAAGQAPSAPNITAWLRAALMEEMEISVSSSHSQKNLAPLPPSLVQKNLNTEILQGRCRDQKGARRDRGRQGCRLPSKRGRPVPSSAGARGRKGNLPPPPDTLWGLGAGAAVDSVKFPKQAPFSQWTPLLGWWPPMIITTSVLR